MIDFNYTAPELLPLRIREVLDAPNEPHRIGGVVYVPEGGGECKNVSYRVDESRFHCSECGFGCWVKNVATGRDELPAYCPNCGRKIRKALRR